MERTMSLSAREELTTSVSARYRQATRPQKRRILDEFTAATGYHRKYAISLLRRSRPKQVRTKVRQRPRRYTGALKEALIVVWQASNRLCSKRLVPFLPELIAALERNGHLNLPEEIRKLLLRISPATVDRLLRELRQKGRRRSFGNTRPGALLKHQIPIRTFADWDDLAPGFLEADLVAHCGTTTQGAYLSSLTLTDVATTWTECLALLMHGQDAVLSSLEQARELFPFPILGLDTDNGSEFLNSGLLGYCRARKITFTRCRPYKKNDQCHVEQKNGSIVRRMVGYDRYEGHAACRQLAALYGVLRLYNNFFQPSMKLVSKERKGSRVIKKYDKAKTPYQRVLAEPTICSVVKESLRIEYGCLDPLELLNQVQHLQNLLWQYAHRPANWTIVGEPLIKPQAATVIPDTRDVLTIGREAEGVVHDHSIELERTRRTYRTTKKPRRLYSGPHYWRTRKDVFAEVWEQVKEQLEHNPQFQTKELFQQLQSRYPGQFKDSQLRTLQRRVRAWREVRIPFCEGVLLPVTLVSQPPVGPSMSQCDEGLKYLPERSEPQALVETSV